MYCISSEKLLKIYIEVVRKKSVKVKYPPTRKHYNIHLYG